MGSSLRPGTLPAPPESAREPCGSREAEPTMHLAHASPKVFRWAALEEESRGLPALREQGS
eukprot:27442-Alexandrium_andersonii.AAC.1